MDCYFDITYLKANWPFFLLFPSTVAGSIHTAVAMRFLSSLLSLALLATGAVAAKKSPTERFNEFHAKQTSNPIKLRDSSYKSLTATPRDYSVAVLLTAADARFACQLCREFQPEWDLVGKSWAKGDKAGESRLIFGTLDFADGRDVFMQVGRPGRSYISFKGH